MRIHVLALNGVFDTGLAAVLDAFSTANALAEITGVRNGEIACRLSSLMTLLQLVDEAHRLVDQHTKQSFSA